MVNTIKPRNLQSVWFVIFWVAAVIALQPTASLADIYMYIDSQGVLHFTNTPTSSNYKLYVKERPAMRRASRSSKQFDPLILAASKKHGIAFPLIKALIKVESDFNPRAVSRSGALGLMQIMPENVEAFKITDPFDPLDNIMGGTWYLGQLLRRFNGQLPLALAAYNAGPTVVEHSRRVPPYKETQDYVQRVMQYYYTYKKS
jgi:soluble lytic murein transglycosylase